MRAEPYHFKPEAAWKMNDEVEAARKMAGWREFHKACAKSLLFFDHIERVGRDFIAVAVIGSGPAHKAAEEKGKTPVLALAAAYRACGRRVPDADPLLDLLLNPELDIDSLLGGDEPDLEDILG